MIEFEWDPAKARSNLAKHGIDFETASHVFDDPFALTEPDWSSGSEERWQTVGLVKGVLLLFVAHITRDEGSVDLVRIISARRATPSERLRYERTRRESSGI